MATYTAPASETLAGDPEGSTGERITRLLAMFVGAGYLFYVFLLAPTIVGQAAVSAPWWPVWAVVLVFVPPISMAVAAFRRRTVWTSRMGKASAIGFVLAAVTWPLAWNGQLVDADTWISLIPGLAAMAAAVVWPPGWTIAVLVAAVIPVQLINHAARTPNVNGPLVPDLLFALSFCLLFVSAALMAMRTGRLLDQTRASAFAVAADAAAADARNVERNRFNALLHDWVMSTLLAAARQDHTDEIRKQARETLRKLDELYGDTTSYDADRTVAYLRTAVTAVDDRQAVLSRVDTAAGTAQFPAEAVHAVTGAVTEALRNSLRHAGDDAERTVSVFVAPGRLRASVVDDGCGFDPAAVAPHRLGLAASIVGRMHRLPGGIVQVRSSVGAGTTVAVGWEQAQ